MLKTKEEIQNYLNKYGGLFIGITIDRGCGTEYFTIVDTGVNDEGNTYLILENTEDEIVDAEFLDSCDFIRFHLTDAVLFKEEPIYNITFKASEIRKFTSFLNKCLIRLAETRNNESRFEHAVVVSLEETLQELINKLNI